MRSVLLSVAAVVTVGSLAACGSSADNGSAGPSSTAVPSSSGSTGGGAAVRQFPGTSGTIADVSGTTLQVQNQTDGQVAVTYTSSTTITTQVAAALSDVTVGSCVAVTPVQSSSTSSSGPAATDAVTAAAVRIYPPQNGSCTGGLSLGGGGRPAGVPTNLPTNRPSGFASGGPSGRFFGGANGKVTAVSATGFTVSAQRPDFGSGQPSAGATPSMTTSTVAVTVDGSTTYSTEKASSAAALAVGKCVTATGQADTTGTIAATRLAVSDPDSSGQCGGGFARFGGPDAGAAGGAS